MVHRLVGTLTMIAATLALAVGCSEDFRKSMDDGFEHTVGFGGNIEANLRGYLENVHMDPADIDCMVAQASESGRWPEADSGGEMLLPPEVLNAFAAACGVDFSALWYMAD